MGLLFRPNDEARWKPLGGAKAVVAALGLDSIGPSHFLDHYDINADTFRSIRELISSHHVTIGGVLCGLAVKMNLWKHRFARGGGGPNRRMEFVKSEILPGLSHIKALEQSARTGHL